MFRRKFVLIGCFELMILPISLRPEERVRMMSKRLENEIFSEHTIWNQEIMPRSKQQFIMPWG